MRFLLNRPSSPLSCQLPTLWITFGKVAYDLDFLVPLTGNLMAAQQSDGELVAAFLNQPDRYTYSGRRLSDCFPWTAFELVFEYGTVLQRSAVRQALMACISLPAVGLGDHASVRHATFEKHLSNLLLHCLRNIAVDNNVDVSDRHLAEFFTDVGDVRPQSSVASEKGDEHADIDGVAIVQQLELALQKALGVRDHEPHASESERINATVSTNIEAVRSSY